MSYGYGLSATPLQIAQAYAALGNGGKLIAPTFAKGERGNHEPRQVLDPVIAEEGVERLAGAHCYEFYATSPEFQRLVDDEPATFFLTDFLARNFERLVIKGLAIDRHPELLQQYFGNYERLVYLAQTDDPVLAATARRAARRLGLRYEYRRTGYGQLATTIAAVAAGQPAPAVTPLLDLGGR